MELCAQLRPASTTAATLYHVADFAHSGQRRKGTRGPGRIIITNVGSAEATCRLFLDPQGATFDETTARKCWNFPIPPGESIEVEQPLLDEDPMHLGVRTGTASAFNFMYEAPAR